MTKDQELTDLKKFIVLLPEESYLRPWLEQELQAIERAMQSDMPLAEYCHGFVELMAISQRLQERERALDKRTAALDRSIGMFKVIVEAATLHAQKIVSLGSQAAQYSGQLRGVAEDLKVVR